MAFVVGGEPYGSHLAGKFWCGNAHGSGDSPIPEQILGSTAGERKKLENQLMRTSEGPISSCDNVGSHMSIFLRCAGKSTLFIKRTATCRITDPLHRSLGCLSFDHSLVSLKVINL